MSEHIAYPLARELVGFLTAGCVRIEIAGSLRREKPEPGDIEIVAIPSLGAYEVRDLFDQVVERHVVNHLDQALDLLLDEGAWILDTEVKRNGPKYKRLKHAASGVCCDLFITDRRRWGYTFTVRTGPAEFSHALVTRALNQGRFFKDGFLHAHPPIYNAKHEVEPCPAGERCLRIIEIPEEVALFNALGLAYIEPNRRSLADPRKIMQGRSS